MCRNACVNEHADHQLLKRVQVAATCHLRPVPVFKTPDARERLAWDCRTLQ